MTDTPDNNFDPQQPVVAVGDEKQPGFLNSTMGKVVLGVVAVVVVLVLGGTAIWFALFSQPGSEAPGKVVTRVVTPAASIAASTSAPQTDPAVITNPQEKPLESTFTFRNVFAPTLKKPTPQSVVDSITAPATSTASGSSSSSSSKVKVPANTLYLSSIQTVDGAKTATFIWNGSTYTLSEGDTLTDTPWKVVEIGDSSVVMLYGDTQVTLTTGQGLSK